MITLKHVSKTYALKGKIIVPAVQDVSLHVDRKEFVVITGRSGSGKTTLLNLIAGLARPTDGQVFHGDVDLWRMTDAQRSEMRNRKMGFVFQFPSLLQSLTSLENVVLPTMFFNHKATATDFERANQLLELVGLSEKRSAYPRQLSAGQQQRVVIARALFNHPELLLADEPTSNLDEETEKEIMALLQKIHKNNGITIILVTHVGGLVTQGTRNVLMVNGAISQDNHQIESLEVQKERG